jgi:GT2 family glycosyltransferase
MKFDIVTVLYNSQKWLTGYLDALCNCDYDKKQLNLILVDNNPTDSTYQSILNNHPIVSLLGSFTFITNPTNVGFGKANNQGAKKGDSPYLLLLNIDTEISVTAFIELESSIKQSTDKTAAWEMRQFPYEHPKVYDPVTQFVTWASAAALVVKREIFEKTGGFDEDIFMYGEDVDLSWNIRKRGYHIRYCPKAIVYHYTYAGEDDIKPTQFYNGLISNLMLRCKYGSWLDIIGGYNAILKVKNSSNPIFENQKEVINNALKGIVKKIWKFRKKHFSFRSQLGDFKPKFLGFDYEIARKGAFHVNKPWWDFSETPLVSVIVRTHKRPLVLENAVISLLHQTYPNIEIIVIEDGENTSQQLMDRYTQNYSNIQYHYTGVNNGRSYAGNYGMAKANGSYLCFLDDDDLVYADHIETIMAEMVEGKFQMIHVPAFCVTTDTLSNNPYTFKEISYEIKHDYPAEKEELLNNNLFPIQAVLFEKKLFDDLGGFDESIDYLEDWALWLKYAQQSEIGYIDKVTSLYRVPSSPKLYKNRLSLLLSTREYVLSHYAHNYVSQKNDLEIAIDHLKQLKPMSSKRVRFHIDLLIYGYNCLSVNGWAIVEKKEPFDAIYLKITQLGNTHYFKLAWNRRPDIQRKFNLRNKQLGFKGDLQVLGISGSVVPITIVYVKNEEFIEQHIDWIQFYKIRYMARLRKHLHSIV